MTDCPALEAAAPKIGGPDLLGASPKIVPVVAGVEKSPDDSEDLVSVVEKNPDASEDLVAVGSEAVDRKIPDEELKIPLEVVEAEEIVDAEIDLRCPFLS